MIQQIKKRFLILAMSSFSAVMFLMITGFLTLNYFQTIQRIDHQAGFYLSFHFEEYPDMENLREAIEDATDPPDDGEELIESLEKNTKPFLDLEKTFGVSLQGNEKEPPHSFRYFYQVYDSNENLEVTYYGPMEKVDQKLSQAAIQNLIKKESKTGWIDGFRYVKATISGNKTVIMLVDVGREVDGIIRSGLIGLGIFVSVLFLVYLILKFFSDKAIQPIVQNIERQKEFISNASHEIKTPLAVLSTNNDVIEMLGTQSEWTQSNRNQIKRLNDLVEQMLLLARFDEGNISLEKTKVSLNRLVSEYVEDVASLADHGGKQIEIDIPEGTFVDCHEASFKQIFNVLMENAIKYHVGDQPIEIKWYSHKKSLWVINDSESMSLEESQRLFERFYRRDTARNREYGGSEIGLSLAQSIASASGMDITNKLIQADRIAFILKF